MLSKGFAEPIFAALVTAAIAQTGMAMPADVSAKPPSLKSLHQATTSKPPAQEKAFPSAYRLIARATERIDHNSSEILVYENHTPVKLPSFEELVVATRLDHGGAFDDFVRKSVALVRSEKQKDAWDVYTDLMWRGRVGEFILPENVFIVRQVLVSSSDHPIRLRVDGRLHNLKPGEALLVLGSS